MFLDIETKLKTNEKKPFSRSAAAEVIRHQRITPEKLELARSFRKNPTESEDAVWQMIRNRKIRNLKWRRQQIIDGFIADFYCAELNVVLEIDGSVHETEEAMLYDEARTEIFARRGIKTYRIKNSDCNIINVTKLVERMISDLTPQPPLLEGEGVEACSMESSSSPIQSSHPSPLRRGVGGEVKTPSPSSFPMQSSHPSPLRRGVGGEVKHIYNPNGTIETAKNINAYLLDGSNVFVESRNKPICAVPEIGIGNKPIDGGNYLFTETEKNEFIQQEPNSAKYFRPWYGSEEFINGKKRFCLWLGDADNLELSKMPKCLERIKAVKEFRLASKSEGTRKIAAKPTRFHVENFPDSNYLLVPRHSSEKRKYIPIGFMDKDIIVGDSNQIIPNATLYEFGILTSIVHNAWMRVVAGRLKSDYRYSKDIVYNNFPWPVLGDSGQVLGNRGESGVEEGNVKQNIKHNYDTKLQRVNRMAEGYADGGRCVSACETATKRGNVCTERPNETGSSIGTIEHSGGIRQGIEERVCSISCDSQRLGMRIGNTTITMCENKLSDRDGHNTSDEPSHGDRQDVQHNNLKIKSNSLNPLTPNPYTLISTAAQKILDIREKYLSQGASLATLYGENLDLLFTDLAEAHRELDIIVLGLYGLGKNASEAEMVARLFEMINNL